MAITVKRIGYGQVEPNHLSAQRTAQIYAQLPATGMNVLENGQFVKYDYANGKVDFTGAGEWMLVFNEVKLYGDKYNETYKDFAMKKENYTEGVMTPRVFKTNIGDIYTTNMIGAANTSADAEYAGVSVKVGDILVPNASGVLVVKASPEATDMQWQVVKEYTLADGQPAVKIMRIK